MVCAEGGHDDDDDDDDDDAVGMARGETLEADAFGGGSGGSSVTGSSSHSDVHSGDIGR
jgi:hypothetical protein